MLGYIHTLHSSNPKHKLAWQMYLVTFIVAEKCDQWQKLTEFKSKLGPKILWVCCLKVCHMTRYSDGKNILFETRHIVTSDDCPYIWFYGFWLSWAKTRWGALCNICVNIILKRKIEQQLLGGVVWTWN